MTVFECHNCIKENCKQHNICDQYARVKAQRFKEIVMDVKM